MFSAPTSFGRCKGSLTSLTGPLLPSKGVLNTGNPPHKNCKQIVNTITKRRPTVQWSKCCNPYLCDTFVGNFEEQLPKKPVGQQTTNSRLTVERLSNDCWAFVARLTND